MVVVTMAHTITGTVSSQSGTALTGAKVKCEGHETSSLANGSYRLENLVPSTYTVTVSLKGFETSEKTVTIEDEKELTVDFILDKAHGTATIKGRVLDKMSGTAISEGTVILILPLANKYSSIGADGSYGFENLPADTYELCTSVPGYRDERTETVLLDGEMRHIDFYCTASRPVEPPWG